MKRFVCSWAALFAAASALSAGVLRAEEPTTRDAASSAALTSPSEAKPNKAQSYRLGIVLEDLHPLVREQLGLTGGATVAKVLPGSPAEKAKLQPLDIILQADKETIGAPADMQKALAACMGGNIGLVIMRGGSRMNVDVTPEAVSPGAMGDAMPQADELLKKAQAQMQSLLKSMEDQSGSPLNLDIDIDLLGPAIVVQSQSSSQMPEDLHIAVSKSGSNPARITVKQKEQSWDVTEDKLDELPAELQPHVRSMLGKQGLSVAGMTGEGLADGLSEKIRAQMNAARERAAAARESLLKEGGTTPPGAKAEVMRIEAEIRRLQKQLEKLQKEGVSTGLRSPSEPKLQSPSERPQTPVKSGGAFAEASSEGISISGGSANGNGTRGFTRTQSRSSTRTSKE